MHETMHHPNLGQTVARTPEEKAAAEKRGFKSGDVHATIVRFGHGDALKPHQVPAPEAEVGAAPAVAPAEYPKALYKGDHPGHIVVKDAKHEATARVEGWGDMAAIPEVVFVPPAPPVAATKAVVVPAPVVVVPPPAPKV